MTMYRKLAIPVICAGAIAISPSAYAQFAVIDSGNLVQAINTARNTMATLEEAKKQVQEAKRLYDSANGLTDIDSVASDLGNAAMRGGLPNGMENAADYIGDPRAVRGILGARVEEVYSSYDFSTDSASSEAFEDAGYAAARDMAVADNNMARAIMRAEGIQELDEHLNTASTAKEVGAVSARASIESAAAINETNRMMALETQRKAQAAAVWRASEARRSRENDENRDKALQTLHGVDL